MEVSRRRILQKHLEPARPLRRLNVGPEPYRQVEASPQIVDKNNIGVETFFQILNLHTSKECPKEKGRISYSREYLIELASSPVAKRKPEFLPDHPVVLEKAVMEKDLSGNLFTNHLLLVPFFHIMVFYISVT